MAIYYPGNNCQDNVPEHLCDPCLTIELGGIRSVAFIEEDFTFTNPASASEWNTGILAGQIIIIPLTYGTFDGGVPQEGQGFGDSPTSLDGYDFLLNYADPNFNGNCDFYDNLKNARNAYKVSWRTETLIYLSDKTVTILPKFPIAQDVKSKVVWSVDVKWTSKNLPCSYTAPDVFDCTQVQ